MKVKAKRRRSKKQIEEDKEREEWEKQETAKKIQRLEALEHECAIMQEKISMAGELYNQVDGLCNQGHLKQNDDGDLVPNENQSERHSLDLSKCSKQKGVTVQNVANRRQAQVFHGGSDKMLTPP